MKLNYVYVDSILKMQHSCCEILKKTDKKLNCSKNRYSTKIFKNNYNLFVQNNQNFHNNLTDYALN